VNGITITNILGEVQTDPMPTKVVYDEQLNIRFLTDRFDRASIDACKGKVNSLSLAFSIGGTTVGYSVGTLLFNGWPLQEQYDEDGALIASQEYQFLYRGDGWLQRFENKSVNELSPGGVLHMGGTNNKHTSLFLGDGDMHEHFLNASGGVATSGQLIAVSTFNGYGTANFSTLLSEIS
jgi:hypothetical protein